MLLANREIGKGYPIDTDEDTGRADYEAPWFAFPNGLTPADPAGADAATKAKADAASHKTSAPAPPPPPANAGGISGGPGVGGGIQMAKPADSQIVDPYSQSQTAIPLTVTVTVVETRQTNEGLAFIAAVFTATRPAINSAIAPLLNLDAASTQDQTTITAQADYAAAYGTAKTALIAYCESASPDATVAGRSDRWTKSSTTRSAQLKANAAALKAALDAPYASIVDISDAIPKSTTKGCGADP